MIESRYDMKENKYKIGDVLYNPYACDLWIVSERYNNEINEEELFIVLIHSDWCEDIEIADSFIIVGNIYEMVEEKMKGDENGEQESNSGQDKERNV